MPNLSNRLSKLEAEMLGGSSQAAIVAATELVVKALNAMTESDFQAFQAGRFDEMSEAAKQAWNEHDVLCGYGLKQIALHRERWRKAMPALIESLRDSEP